LGPPEQVSGGQSASPLFALLTPEFDFALVGRIADPEGIVVAFRGTLPPLDLSPDGKRIGNPAILGLPVILDWANNVRADLVLGAQVRAGQAAATIPGAVHEGFAGSLARLWPGVSAAIDRLRGADAAPRLYFTGHSKGGALANLAAVCARQVWQGASVKVATFGAARAGDEEFARAFAAAGIDCQRYEVMGDLVPGLPPAGRVVGTGSEVRYCEPVGTEHRLLPLFYGRTFSSFLPWSGDNRGSLPHPVAAHLPYRTFGYETHVCEDGCAHDWA
jgi:hypothetical protein